MILKNDLLCASLLPVYLSILLIISPISNAKADEVVEVGSVTATVTSEDVRRGNLNASEGEPRNVSHFPNHPELYVPLPHPQVDSFFIESSIQDSEGWISYEIATGDETISEQATVDAKPSS